MGKKKREAEPPFDVDDVVSMDERYPHTVERLTACRAAEANDDIEEAKRLLRLVMERPGHAFYKIEACTRFSKLLQKDPEITVEEVITLCANAISTTVNLFGRETRGTATTLLQLGKNVSAYPLIVTENRRVAAILAEMYTVASEACAATSMVTEWVTAVYSRAGFLLDSCQIDTAAESMVPLIKYLDKHGSEYPLARVSAHSRRALIAAHTGDGTAAREAAATALEAAEAVEGRKLPGTGYVHAMTLIEYGMMECLLVQFEAEGANLGLNGAAAGTNLKECEKYFDQALAILAREAPGDRAVLMACRGWARALKMQGRQDAPAWRSLPEVDAETRAYLIEGGNAADLVTRNAEFSGPLARAWAAVQAMDDATAAQALSLSGRAAMLCVHGLGRCCELTAMALTVYACALVYTGHYTLAHRAASRANVIVAALRVPTTGIGWSLWPAYEQQLVARLGEQTLPRGELGGPKGVRFYKCNLPECTNAETSVNGFKMCTRCKNARYCSPDHQKEDWKKGGHKQVCKE